MKPILRTVALCTLAMTLTGGISLAQDHRDDHPDQRDNHHYVRHDEWRKGARMNHDDWNRGERVDYRHSHLHAPPRGYEWREVDGNYVMAAVATGVIASVVAASAAH
jgi:Ni/Co efflux regulator RcnB